MTDPANGDLCPKCGTETQMGFGLAGGGYGAYRFCPTCEEILEKWQEDDGQPTEEKEWHDYDPDC